MKINSIILGLLLFSTLALAAPVYNVSTIPSELYATSKHLEIISFKHEFSNCDCPDDYRYTFFLDLPQWYDGGTIRDFNAFTSDPSDPFAPVNCFYNTVDNQIVCDEYVGEENILDIDSFNLSYTISTNYSEGNPIRNETWTPTVKCLKGSDILEYTLSDNIIFTTPQLTLAAPTQNIVNKIFTVSAYEVAGKGIPYFVKFEIEHPSETIPEQSDSDRSDGWGVVFDTTHKENAEVLLSIFACDHKLNCGPPLQKLLTITDANLTEEIVDENVTNTPPEIISAYVDDADKILMEAQQAKFVAEVVDADGDDLNYLWTFGDGTTSEEESPTHAYTLTEGRKRQSFPVALTVTDGTDTEESAFLVTVEKSTILIEFISPAKESFRKNEEVPIRVSISDLDYLPVDGIIAAFIVHRKEKKEVELTKVETGIYEGTFNPTIKTYENSYLHIDVDYNVNGHTLIASREKSLNFKPQKISVKIEKTLAVEEEIGEIELIFEYPDGTTLETSDIEVEDVEISFKDKKYSLEEKEGKFVVTIKEKSEEVTLTIEGTDIYGNTIETEKKLETITPTPELEEVDENKIIVKDELTEEPTEIDYAGIILALSLVALAGAAYHFRDKLKDLKKYLPKKEIEQQQRITEYQTKPKEAEKPSEEREKQRTERRKKREDEKVMKIIEEEYEGTPTKAPQKGTLRKISEFTTGMLPQSPQVEEPPAEQDIALEEQKEIRRLVRLLGTKKSSYSREEIAKALFGEGYSERIVLGVLEKLYRK